MILHTPEIRKAAFCATREWRAQGDAKALDPSVKLVIFVVKLCVAMGTTDEIGIRFTSDIHCISVLLQ